MNIFRSERSGTIKLIFFISFVILFTFSPALYAMQSGGISIEEIQHPKFLQEIAHTILRREEQLSSLKEKVCKHNETMIQAWKSGKKWGELDPGQQRELTKFIPQSQVKSIMRRPRHSLLSPEIIEHPESFAQTIVEKGKPFLLRTGEKMDGYAIKISVDIAPKIAGTMYSKVEQAIQETPESRIYISFDVTKLIFKLMKSGVDVWDKSADGFVTTLCLDE